MSSGSPHIPVIRSLAQLRRWRAAARERGLEVGVVPTVGRPAHGSLCCAVLCCMMPC
jgi:pantoate--beta-alanine ligase